MAFRRGLVAEQAQEIRIGANKNEAGFRAGVRQFGVFAQKPIPWVNRLALRRHRCSDDLLDRQIGARSFPGQRDRTVRRRDMRCVPVIGGKNGNGSQAERCCRSSDADGNLAAVGD
nr:hypothetical protein [Sphingomonas mucosissima]